MKKIMKVFLIIVLCFLALTFAAYMTNADMKLVEKIYDKLIKYHDSRDIDEHI